MKVYDIFDYIIFFSACNIYGHTGVSIKFWFDVEAVRVIQTT